MLTPSVQTQMGVPLDGRRRWCHRGGMKTFGGALAVVVVAMVTWSAVPAAAVQDPDPRTVPRGPDAAVPYLQSGVIHDRGRTLKVTVAASAGRRALLGRHGNGWLVASGRAGRSSAQVSVHQVRRGRAPRLVPRGRVTYPLSEFRGVLLNRGSTRLVWSSIDRGGSQNWVRRLSTGARVGHTATNGPFIVPTDATATRILTHREDEVTGQVNTVIWRPGVGTTVVGPASSGGFLQRDVFFVRTGENTYGPTALSAPAAPAWSATFAPLDLSPDGTRVLGTTGTLFAHRQVLQVRRMSDGAVLNSWTFGRRDPEWSAVSSGEETARFESNGKVVFEVRRGTKAALLRCRVVGTSCTRASRWGGSVSFARERFMW